MFFFHYRINKNNLFLHFVNLLQYVKADFFIFHSKYGKNKYEEIMLEIPVENEPKR